MQSDILFTVYPFLVKVEGLAHKGRSQAQNGSGFAPLFMAVNLGTLCIVDDSESTLFFSEKFGLLLG